MDPLNRSVVNVLVAPLDGTYHKPRLVDVQFVKETNHKTISQAFEAAIKILFPVPDYKKLIVVTTDQAGYMIKAFKNLRETLYDNLYHVTCLAHSLHRVAEVVRTQHPLVNSFVSNMKKVLKKSPRRRSIYYTETKLTELPPNPITTRWGSFIKAADFYAKNFSKMKTFIDQLKYKESAAVQSLKDLIKKPDLPKQNNQCGQIQLHL